MIKKIVVIISVFMLARIDVDAIVNTELYTFVADTYIEKCTDIPVVRSLNGGTVFNVYYEGEWTPEKKGAFEYATKIWAENLPTIFPINITARIGTVGNGAVSKVLVRSYDSDFGMAPDENLLSSRAQIKAVIFMEYMRGMNYSYCDSIKDCTFFNENDITITYNENRLEEISFSLESTPVNKYDFVSLVLRDIARGLGFCSEIIVNEKDKTLGIPTTDPLPFEAIIRSALGSSDSKVAYSNATKGYLTISNGMKLYAPEIWKNGVSLNYFIPDGKNKISEVLSYDFGKGTVMRDVSDSGYESLFRKFLKWTPNYVVSSDENVNGVSSSGSTQTIIPYRGELTLSSHNRTKLRDKKLNQMHYVRSNTQKIASDSLLNYCMVYHPYNIGNGEIGNPGGCSVSILLKNGTWDIIYYKDILDASETVKIGDMDFHYSVDDYARTCEGYLRGRVTFGYFDCETNGMKYDVSYLAIDYLPQSVESEILSRQPVEILNDYVQKFDFGINNLEGSTKIVVEQLVEGDRLPTRFEVPDFKKGYFTASVDVDLFTQFTVVSYNQNGMTRGNTYKLSPINSSSTLFTARLLWGKISFIINNQRLTNLRRVVRYELSALTVSSGIAVRPLRGVVDEDSQSIDVSGLKRGIYLLKFWDNMENSYNYNFRIQ